MTPTVEQTGVLESAEPVPLAEALARWRREAHFGVCDTGRYRCRYFAWGRGQPVVFVHGLSDRARSFVPVMAHLTDVFRCVAYELPSGDGDGARLGRVKHQDLADDVFALLDHLRVEQAGIYGASFGATVALRALAARPRRFLRAALQGGFARLPLGPGEAAALSLMRYWPGRLRDLPLFAASQRRADAPAFARVPPEVWEFQRANTAATPLRAFARRALAAGRLDLRSLLPAVRHPVLLITGDCDTVVRRDRADELAAGLPHADRLEFADCGHHAQYTHAAGVAAALRRFLLPPCGL